MRPSKVLFFDIEIVTASWCGFMGADKTTICTFGYKWQDEARPKAFDLNDWKDIFQSRGARAVEREMVKEAHKIMKQADRVVAHFGQYFDYKYMNTLFTKYGLGEIDVELVDTWRLAKNNLKLSSNRLDAIAKFFGLPTKDKMDHDDWIKIVMERSVTAMEKMTKYCKQDVLVLEAVYNRLEHLANPRTHIGLLCGGSRMSCMQCGHDRLHKHDIVVTRTAKYRRFKCPNCGSKRNKITLRQSYALGIDKEPKK